MTSITLPNDIADALKAGRLTYPEAHELSDLRRTRSRVDKRRRTAQAKANKVAAELKTTAERSKALESKANPSEADEAPDAAAE